MRNNDIFSLVSFFDVVFLRGRIGEIKLSKTNSDGVSDFLWTLPKETVVDFRLFRPAGMLRILADSIDY